MKTKFNDFLNERKQSIIRPIRHLFINGTEINNTTNWQELLNSGKEAEFYAYDLFTHNSYPTYLKSAIENRFGEQEFLIIPSNHFKYRKAKEEHPEWFEYTKYVYDLQTNVFSLK